MAEAKAEQLMFERKLRMEFIVHAADALSGGGCLIELHRVDGEDVMRDLFPNTIQFTCPTDSIQPSRFRRGRTFRVDFTPRDS